MLNQTDISKNANKYYIAQVIESDDRANPSYHVFTRWGRVGEPGQNKPCPHYHKAGAISQFFSIFKSKSGISWEQRDTAPPKAGKYTYIPRAYESDAEESDMGESQGEDSAGLDGELAGPSASSSPVKGKKKQKESQLDGTVRDLAQLIFSDKIMSQALSE